MKIIDIKTPDNIDEYWKNRIEDYCAENINQKTEPQKYLNYQKENLKINEHLYFSALFNNDKLVCFAGIYNAGRYSPWIHRILNRTYLVPEYRTTAFKIKKNYYSTQYITSHQLTLWQKPQMLFFSMQEPRRTERAFINIQKTITGFEHIHWNNREGFCQVVDGNDQSCYQKVSYANFSNEKLIFDLPSITEKEYNERFTKSKI